MHDDPCYTDSIECTFDRLLNTLLGEMALVTEVDDTPKCGIQAELPLVVPSRAWPEISSRSDGGPVPRKHGMMRKEVLKKSECKCVCVCVCVHTRHNVPPAVSCVLRCLHSDGHLQLRAALPIQIHQPSRLDSLGQCHRALSTRSARLLPDSRAVQCDGLR